MLYINHLLMKYKFMHNVIFFSLLRDPFVLLHMQSLYINAKGPL